jgi:hypothetical protein
MMFVVLAYVFGGYMGFAARGQGGLLVRADPAEGAKLVASGKAQPMQMRGRSMGGWLRVDADDVRQKRQLEKWVKVGTTYAKSLPPKSAKRKK